MELVFSGVSVGTAEDMIVVLKGKVTDFEKLYSMEQASRAIIDREAMFDGG